MDSQILKPSHWIVLDNSDTPDQDWSIAKENPLVYYEQVSETKPIGWLRNRCLDLALEREADFIVFWDDDDYYPPTRISSGIEALVQTPNGDIAGSSKMYLLLTKENVLMTTGPFHDHHATAATWTIRKKYAQSHRFDPEKTRGEELSFTKEWTANMVQVEPEKVIVVMGHSHNTVDKSDLLERPHVYKAEIVNQANGRMCFRMKWPVQWGLFQSTFSA